MNSWVRFTFRLGGSLFAIYTVVFLAFAVVPLDPARAVLGPNASEQAVERLREEFGLNRSLPVRYFATLRQMLSGDFGSSYYLNKPALEVVRATAPKTFARTGIALLSGLLVGALAGAFPITRGRRVLSVSLVVMQSIPSFCVMLIFLWAASRLLGCTPLQSPRLYELLTLCGAAAYTTGAVGLFVLQRTSPEGMQPRHIEFLEMLGAPAEYVHSVRWKESLPGAIAIMLNAFGVALTAVMFAELIFGILGFGLVFLRSCERGDLSIVVAGAMIIAAIVVTIQRIGDFMLQVVDPRITGE